MVYISKLTYFKLIIVFGLERFLAKGWEYEMNIQINVPVRKSSFESSLSDDRLSIRWFDPVYASHPG